MFYHRYVNIHYFINSGPSSLITIVPEGIYSRAFTDASCHTHSAHFRHNHSFMTISKTFSFPTFYACYLLKSVQSLRSYRNYIGSTRDPQRRLRSVCCPSPATVRPETVTIYLFTRCFPARQHNGVIGQGARGTAAYRPWAMQLLVHGFPSKPVRFMS